VDAVGAFGDVEDAGDVHGGNPYGLNGYKNWVWKLCEADPFSCYGTVTHRSLEMEQDVPLHGHQTATSLESQENRCATPERQASFFADLPLRRAIHHSGVEESRSLSFGRAKAQRRCMRDEILESKYQLAYRDGAFAEFELKRHIGRSLPVALLAKQTILRWFVFAIHRRAADIALCQALRLVLRRDLKRAGDTKDFVLDHCDW